MAIKAKLDVDAMMQELESNTTGIMRYRKDNYDMESCMELVSRIGKYITPQFILDSENLFTYENFVKWLHCDPTMKAINPTSKEIIEGNFKKGIYIAGNTGTGKSLCLEVMLRYALMFNFKIIFGDKHDYILWQNVRAEEIVADFVKYSNVDTYKDCKILCIQDFGSETLEATAMGNKMNVMRNLIESRGDKINRITLITSNLPINHPTITQRYGERVMSRLMGMCNYFEIKGKDRRL